MKGFKPMGIARSTNVSIRISFEEYEAIRLVEYENFPQDKAAKTMNISRPTLTRIYNNALKKIASAFVEGKAIEIIGGNYQLETDWYRCRNCHKLFEGMVNHRKCKRCPEHGTDELINLNNQ